MAPEQVSADPQVDHRVDLYAWGCLPYELLTGATPFGHRTPSAVYAAHLTETPTPVAVHRADAPPALAALVMQCLAKDPAARPASARSLVAVLEGVGTPSAIVAPRTTQPMNRTRAVVVGVIVLLAVVGGWQAVRWRGSRTATERAALGATSPATSMAVLLFENGSKDSTFDYFAEGLSDDVHSQLTQVQGLQVKARGLSMALHARGLEPREIGRTLAVTAVLSGVVRRSPDRVGITAEPVNVSTGDAMWSRTFDVPARDVVPLRDSLASAIAVALRGKLAPVASASAPALDPGTYDLLLRARYAADRSNFPRALENLQAALARSPGSPEVNAMLATVYVAFAATGVDKSDFLLTLAQQAAERAARRDPQSLAALRARTAVLRAQFQFPESYETIRQAAARDSSDIGLLLSASNSAWLVGRLDKIPLFAARALRVDPMNVQVFVISQYSAILRRDYRSALQFGARVLEVDPDNEFGLANNATAYLFLGQIDSAVVNARRAAARGLYGNDVSLVLMLATAGQWTAVDSIRIVVTARAAHSNSLLYDRMFLALADGDTERAIDEFGRGLDAHEPVFLTTAIGCDPLFTPMLDKPRFAEILRRYGSQSCKVQDRWPVAPRPKASR